MRDDGNPNGVEPWLDGVSGRHALRPMRRDPMASVARRISGDHAVAHPSLLWMQRP